jgi:hypothetical protein
MKEAFLIMDDKGRLTLVYGTDASKAIGRVVVNDDSAWIYWRRDGKQTIYETFDPLLVEAFGMAMRAGVVAGLRESLGLDRQGTLDRIKYISGQSGERLANDSLGGVVGPDKPA